MNDTKNISEDIKLNRLFIQHLENYKPLKKIIKIAEQIDFKGILDSFDDEFNNLWNKLSIKEPIKNSKEIKSHYRDQILSILNQSFFNAIYIGIKDLDLKQLNFEELNKNIQEDFKTIIRNLLKVFDIKNLSILLPQVEDDKKIITIESDNDESSLIEKTINLPDKKFNPVDIPHYKKVLEFFNEQKEKEQNLSLRQAALEVAKTEMGLTDKQELQIFYNRFINYKRKKQKKKSHRKR